VKVVYKERPGPEGVSPKRAAEDYSRWRTERAAEVLRGLDAQLEQEKWEAEIAKANQETPPAPEAPEPPKHEDLERQAFQQKAAKQLAALEQGRQNYEYAPPARERVNSAATELKRKAETYERMMRALGKDPRQEGN
jgi:hypothetical protein